MYVGNCENFGTEWEELEKRVEIVEANSKEEVKEKYNDTIYDCDCKSFHIEELGAPCYKVMLEDKCMEQFETIDEALSEFEYQKYRLMGYSFELSPKEAVEKKLRIELGTIE